MERMQQTEIEPPESRLIDLRKDLDYLTDRCDIGLK